MGSYVRPTALIDALTALAERPRTVLAGGTAPCPPGLLGQTEDVLDITALPDQRAIESYADHWRIACLTTWTDLATATLPPLFDGIVGAARQIGGRQVQNAGTLVGNLCSAAPTADGIPCLLALDTMVELASLRGRRTLPIAAFACEGGRTARAPDELVIALRVPRPGLPTCATFNKLGGRRYLAVSIATIAVVAMFGPGDRIASARVAVGACQVAAQRLPLLEAALCGTRPDPMLVQFEHLAPLTPISDAHASGAYRRDAVLEMLRRAIGGLAPKLRAAG